MTPRPILLTSATPYTDTDGLTNDVCRRLVSDIAIFVLKRDVKLQLTIVTIVCRRHQIIIIVNLICVIVFLLYETCKVHDFSLKVCAGCTVAIIVNECLAENGDCEQICIDTPDSYYCLCDPGLKLKPTSFECPGIYNLCYVYHDVGSITAKSSNR